MKVPKKKLICRLLAMALVASPIFEWGIIPVHASESSGVTLTESYSETGNQNCEVTVNIGSGFTVKIPKKITLSGADGTSPYNVTVEGDIGASEIIKVKPDKDFNLKSSGKTDVTSTVTQSKTSFDYEDLTDKMVDLSIFLGSQSYRFDMDVQSIADNNNRPDSTFSRWYV